MTCSRGLTVASCCVSYTHPDEGRKPIFNRDEILHWAREERTVNVVGGGTLDARQREADRRERGH